MERILSIDPAYDPHLSRFRQFRKATYSKIEHRFGVDVDMPHQSIINKSELLSRCRSTEVVDGMRKLYYSKLAFCSHGGPGVIFIRDEQGQEMPLLSMHDSDEFLRTIVRDRSVYFMACNVAQGDFFERMMNLGARDAVGFTMKPRWGSYTKNLWHNIDSHFLHCLIRDDFGMSARNKRISLMKVINRNIQRGDYAMNLGRMDTMRRAFHTLRTMKVLVQ